MNNNINPKFLKDIFIQDEKKVPIQGVRIVELKNFVTEDGYFIDVAHFKNGILEIFPDANFEVKQVNLSKSMANSVKAWHFHNNQEDVWFVPPDSKLLVGLVDLRENSPTKDVKMRIVMGEGLTKLLYIPREVAHGYRNLKNSDSFIIYLVNNIYNSKEPDEKRLSWDYFGKDFWEIKNG